MNIGFTGHRDRQTLEQDLQYLHEDYPTALWVLGGAIGFDTQVENFARAHNHPYFVLKPDYLRYGKRAPLVRDDEIVERSDLLVVCWDGFRKKGGTWYTLSLARRKDKEIRFVPCVEGI